MLNFSAEQLSELQTILDAAQAEEGSNPFAFAAVYELAFSFITEYDADGNPLGPLSGVDPGAWLWLESARKINAGEGIFSTFIRAYTAEQYKIRFGNNMDPSAVQVASNEIAKVVILDAIKEKSWLSLNYIGTKDALKATKGAFNNDLSVWSGNFLFLGLGDGSFFYENIIGGKGSNDTYDLLVGIQAFVNATQAVASEILDGFLAAPIGGDYLANVIIELWNASSGISNLIPDAHAVIAGALKQADQLLAKIYGPDVTLASLVLNILESEVDITLLEFSDENDDYIRAGKIHDDEALEGTSRDDFLHGGDGNDRLIGSEGEDIIDGGKGDDIVDYSAMGESITFDLKTDSREGFLGEVTKNEGVFSNDYDLIFNVETLRASDLEDDSIDASKLDFAIRLDLSTGALTNISDPNLFSLNIEGFERITGTMHGDVISSGDGRHEKTIEIDGGEGEDRFILTDTGPYVATIGTDGKVELQGGDGSKDTIINFEKLEFSYTADVVKAESWQGVLASGIKEIDFGVGVDVLDLSDLSENMVVDAAQGDWIVIYDAANEDASIRVKGVEKIILGDGDDYYIGGSDQSPTLDVNLGNGDNKTKDPKNVQITVGDGTDLVQTGDNVAYVGLGP